MREKSTAERGWVWGEQCHPSAGETQTGGAGCGVHNAIPALGRQKQEALGMGVHSCKSSHRQEGLEFAGQSVQKMLQFQ